MLFSQEQEQLLHWALTGFPEETIAKENEKINHARTILQQHRAELEKGINSSTQEKMDIHNIEVACALVRKSLTELSFENKRLALEALNITVWINGENIKIEGCIPIKGRVIATTQSLPRLFLGHLLYL